MVSHPTVSVLMTAYNPGRYLFLALNSLWRQSYPNFELILIDNGCQDGCIQQLQAQGTDERCKLTQLETNIGRTPALKLAFELAVADYIAILDADDIWHHDHLFQQVKYLNQHPDTVLLGTWYRLIDGNGKELGQITPPTTSSELCEAMAWGNPFANSSTLFRRAAAAAQGGYNTNFAFAQDFDLWLNLSRVGQVAILPQTLTEIRILASSVTRSPNYRLTIAQEQLSLYQRAGQQFPLSTKAQQAHRKAVAHCAVDYGSALVDVQSPLQGLGWMVWGFMRDPLILLRRSLRSLKQLLKSLDRRGI